MCRGGGLVADRARARSESQHEPQRAHTVCTVEEVAACERRGGACVHVGVNVGTQASLRATSTTWKPCFQLVGRRPVDK